MMRIYNEWLADFCDAHPERYAGLACIPNSPIEAAVDEIKRVIKRGAVRGLEIANSHDMTPLWDPYWNPLWEVANEAALPVHFHTIGEPRPDLAKLPPQLARVEHAVHITGFQIHMANTLMSVIFGGVLERYPQLKIVIGESGIGWIPYVLDRMDAEWEDQFKDLEPHDEAERILASPVPGDLPERSHRHQAARRLGARQHHVGLGLPAPRRHLARLAASSSSASWATCPRRCAARSSARTPASFTASLNNAASCPASAADG